MKETLDVFFREMALPIVMRAGAEYQQHGRGMLRVGPFRTGNSVQTDGSLFPATYVTLACAKALGYSPEFIEAIEGYDPKREAVLFLDCGDTSKLLKLELECGAGGASAVN